MMRRIITTALAMIICASCTGRQSKPMIQQVSPIPSDYGYQVQYEEKQTDNYEPINFQEQKAVWISYIDLQHMLLGKTENEFSENILQAYEKIKSLGCNTVYVHVRSFGDAYYKSEFYPFTKAVSGELGSEADFDPLEIMLENAHEAGLSFHAWVNPMRCETEENMLLIPERFALRRWFSDRDKYDEYLVKVDSDNHYWLNPAVEDVRNLIADGVREIVKNYDVDGIHIDDYFYPTTEAYFDSGIYVETGVTESLSEWRKSNINKMVKAIHDAVKDENPNVLFGVSPQGNMENNYQFMYADVKKWCSEEDYIDYIVPQIYFGFENSIKPFVQTAEDWSSIVTCDSVSLVIGLGVYKIGEEDEFLQNTGIIAEQISSSQQIKNYGGFALYNYINLFEPVQELAERTNAELQCIKDAIID